MTPFPTSLKRASRGMTLTEMLIAMGIGGLVLAVVGMMMLYGSRSFAALSHYLEMNQKSRLALDTISADVRHATHLISFVDDRELVFNHVTLEDPDIDPIEGTLTYTYDPDSQELIRTYTTNGVDFVKTVLLEGCDTFNFELYQRNPYAGPMPQNFAASTPETCKLVELQWRCTRSMLDLKKTESVQTARIVLRN